MKRRGENRNGTCLLVIGKNTIIYNKGMKLYWGRQLFFSIKMVTVPIPSVQGMASQFMKSFGQNEVSDSITLALFPI